MEQTPEPTPEQRRAARFGALPELPRPDQLVGRDQVRAGRRGVTVDVDPVVRAEVMRPRGSGERWRQGAT